MVIGTLIALAVVFGTDPDAGIIQLTFGADVMRKLSAVPASIFGVGVLWISTKALYDYLNPEQLTKKASETPEGAGLALIGLGLGRIAIAIVVVGLIFVFV